MAKIFVIIGKSATGKDTIFKRLIADKRLSLKVIIGYTTRPMRSGEANGIEYYFVNEDKMNELRSLDKIIEMRSYKTIHGVWNYFTVNDGQIDLLKFDYLFIETLEGYEKLIQYFGDDAVIPIYLEVSDKTRIHRAIEREDVQERPRYAELCRRFLADETDFSEEQLSRLKIQNRYTNENLEDCFNKIYNDLVRLIGKRAECF